MDNPRLLIVDDEQSSVLILKKTFQKDFTLAIAADGEEALCQVNRFLPDLILLDVMMPGIDGFEVSRRLKEESATKDIPIIFLTALEEEREEERGLRLGAVDFVSKPIRPEVVRLRVNTHLMLKRQAEQLKRQAEELARLADLDSLTGIANRRAFDRELLKDIHRTARAGLPLSLLMVDIDFFKSYNDRYGHLLGDKCLQRVALCLEDTLPRKTDHIARYGGEEFCCILFNTDLKGAEKVAEHLIRAVSDLQIGHKGSEISDFVSVSIGGCSLVPTMQTLPEDLIDCADRQLYRAKDNGRNRISMCHGGELQSVRAKSAVAEKSYGTVTNR